MTNSEHMHSLKPHALLILQEAEINMFSRMQSLSVMDRYVSRREHAYPITVAMWETEVGAITWACVVKTKLSMVV